MIDFRRQGRLIARTLVGPDRVESLSHLFRSVNRWLRELGVDYWIVYGTLLGFHRNGGLLPRDRDVDFGLLARDAERVKAAADRLPEGFVLHDTSHKHPGPKMYVEHRGWEADLYFYEERGDELVCLLDSWIVADRTPFLRELVFPLGSGSLLGEETRIPNQVFPYLEFMYGYIGPDARQDPRTGIWYPSGSRPRRSWIVLFVVILSLVLVRMFA